MALIEFNQKGKPTYQYDDFCIIFSDDPDKASQELCAAIIDKFAKIYKPSLKVGDTNIGSTNKWTDLGPSSTGYIALGKYTFRFSCFRDGWHINMLDRYGGFNHNPDLKIKLFGDVNRTGMWTQETEKVSHTMSELYNTLKELGEMS